MPMRLKQLSPLTRIQESIKRSTNKNHHESSDDCPSNDEDRHEKMPTRDFSETIAVQRVDCDLPAVMQVAPSVSGCIVERTREQYDVPTQIETSASVEASKSLEKIRKIKRDLHDAKLKTTPVAKPHGTSDVKPRSAARQKTQASLPPNTETDTISNIQPKKSDSFFLDTSSTVQQARLNEKSLMNATVQGNVKPPPSPRMSKPRVSLRIDTSLSATRPSLPRTPSQPKHKSPKTPRRPGTPRTPTTPKTSKELIDDIVSMYESGIIPTTPNFDYVSIPVGSASPKDITRAYSTSKSWGKVVGAVIIAQAAARRWLAIRTVDRMRKEFSLAATKIASVWRGYIEFMAYRQLVKGMDFIRVLTPECLMPF